MNSVHEPGSRTMSKNRLSNNTESKRIENRPSAQPAASLRAQALRPARPAVPARLPSVRLPRAPRPPARPPAPASLPAFVRLPAPARLPTFARLPAPARLPAFARLPAPARLPPACHAPQRLRAPVACAPQRPPAPAALLAVSQCPAPCRSAQLRAPSAFPCCIATQAFPKLTIQFVLQYKPAAQQTILQYSFFSSQAASIAIHLTLLQYNFSPPSFLLCNTKTVLQYKFFFFHNIIGQ